LYSVMEIQLFHKKALEWSDLSKEKNPYLKFMKNQEGIDYEKRNKKREERWVRYLPKIKAKREIKEKLSYEEMKQSYDCQCESLTLEDFNKVDAHFKVIYDKFIKLEITIEEFDDAWYKETYENTEHEEIRLNPAYWSFNSYWGNEVYLHFMKQKYLNPSNDGKEVFGSVPWEMVYMNILWNTYEAIPLMKKLPQLSDHQQEQVSLSLENYLPLLKNKEFKDVSIKNLMLLSGVSLLSLYSASFDLEEVDSIQDLYCSFDPSIIIENYALIRKRVLFIHQAYENAGINGEEYKKYKTQIDSIKESLPVELTPVQKERFVNSVDNFKVDSCFNG
nr:hypothetical protein [Bdellovibrionales bacterium]